MKAIIDISEIAAELEAVRTAVYPHEFSGFGIVEPGDIINDEPSFKVAQWFLLDVGSSVLTTISIEDQLRLASHPDIKFMRCWIHAHPVGNGIPGPRNWSGTDNHAIEWSPMGTVPELMDWMIAIVRTPNGWVGRFDQPDKEITHHLKVEPSFYNQVKMAKDLVKHYNEVQDSRHEFGFLQAYDHEEIEQLGLFMPGSYEEEEEHEQLYGEISRSVQSDRARGKDSGSWWNRILRNPNTG